MMQTLSFKNNKLNMLRLQKYKRKKKFFVWKILNDLIYV